MKFTNSKNPIWKYLLKIVTEIIIGLGGATISIMLYTKEPLTPLIFWSVSIILVITISFLVYFIRHQSNLLKRLANNSYPSEKSEKFSERLAELFNTSTHQLNYSGIAATFIFSHYDDIVNFLVRVGDCKINQLDPGIFDKSISEGKHALQIKTLIEREKSKIDQFAKELLQKLRLPLDTMPHIHNNLKKILDAPNKHEAIILASSIIWVSAWAEARKQRESIQFDMRYHNLYMPFKVWFFGDNICLCGTYAQNTLGVDNTITEYVDRRKDKNRHENFENSTRPFVEIIHQIEKMKSFLGNDDPTAIYDQLIKDSSRILGIDLDR